MLTGNKLITYLKIKTFNFKEKIITIFKFYKNIKFAFADLILSFIYLFINPYRISKNFLKNKKLKNIHVYGETPSSALFEITKRVNIREDDLLLELGSGRGLSSFWFSEIARCKVEAVEWIPLFCNISRFLTKLLRMKRMSFINENIFNYDFRKPDIIYLYGTCLEDDEIFCLIKKFKKIEKPVKIITISYSLREYDKFFIILDSFKLTFPWGKTEGYINLKK